MLCNVFGEKHNVINVPPTSAPTRCSRLARDLDFRLDRPLTFWLGIDRRSGSDQQPCLAPRTERPRGEVLDIFRQLPDEMQTRSLQRFMRPDNHISCHVYILCPRMIQYVHITGHVVIRSHEHLQTRDVKAIWASSSCPEST